MINEAEVWAIVGLPLVMGVITLAVIRPAGPAAWPAAGLANIAGVAGAFALSIMALLAVQDSHDEVVGFAPHTWLTIGEGPVAFELTIGVLLDPLSALMVAVVSGVSTLVQIYSLGYVRKSEEDWGGPFGDYPRYFAYMSLFTAAMLGLVLSYNLIQTFVFWELVGLFSYLLIGFWFHRPAAAAAAKKAFIMTRIGDFGFMIALMWIFSHRSQFVDQGLNPFEIPDINVAAPLLSGALVSWAALGLFAGAVGKSAQFPLNTWLPDAMEGPTPVSSLIHAATMVAAGVFLVARLFPLFEEATAVLNVVALTGAITAVLAASMALVTYDIKRVLAFSTVSQLGYMFIALGLGAPVVAMFHLFTHAFFKCLLFLTAGNVHHSVHTFDMRYMGGLRRWMPVTYGLTIIGGLSLAGVFPFAGFWSKDEVLAVAWHMTWGDHATLVGVVVFVLAMVTAGLTAFYVFRLIMLTYHGEFRGGIDSVPMDERIPDEAHHHVHRAESPWEMLLPMIVLAVFAIGAGFVFNGTRDIGPIEAHWFAHFFHEDAPHIVVGLAVAASLIAIGGIAYAIYTHVVGYVDFEPGEEEESRFKTILQHRFFMDYLYETLIVRRALLRGVFAASDWADRRIVDGAVDFVGWTGRNAGRFVGQLQTGQVQMYGIVVSVGAIALLWAFLVRS